MCLFSARVYPSHISSLSSFNDYKEADAERLLWFQIKTFMLSNNPLILLVLLNVCLNKVATELTGPMSNCFLLLWTRCNDLWGQVNSEDLNKHILEVILLHFLLYKIINLAFQKGFAKGPFVTDQPLCLGLWRDTLETIQQKTNLWVSAKNQWEVSAWCNNRF